MRLCTVTREEAFLDDERASARSVTIATLFGAALVGLVTFVAGSVLGGGGIGLLLGVPGAFVGGILTLILALAVNSAVEVVPAYEKRAYTVFGDFKRILDPGLNLVYPLISETTAFDMRTQTIDVPSQEAITEDNSPVVANAVIYIRVTDPERAFLEIENYEVAVANLAQTTLRAVLGDMQLDDTLSRRREINERIREDLDEPTDEWGVKVESVEVQEITPSQDVLRSMEQQTAAERRRRAMILEAQGERRSDIQRAEGDKQSDIIVAQGEKQAQILEAQGDAISTVLRSRSAESMGERAVIDKGMETLASIGQGESTTYVLPQELSSMLGRYGKHLTGSDANEDGEKLHSQAFDTADREMLGLDDIEEILDDIQNGGATDGDRADVGVEDIEDVEFDEVSVDDVDEADVGVDVDVDTAKAEASMKETATEAASAVEDATNEMDAAMPDLPDGDPAEEAGDSKTREQKTDLDRPGDETDGQDPVAGWEEFTDPETETETETETDADGVEAEAETKTETETETEK
jgi:regulator of protease activity HflC (stomatin/prohibitin superfamily)